MLSKSLAADMCTVLLCFSADDLRGGTGRATRPSTRQQTNLMNRVGTSLVALDNRLRHILNNEREAASRGAASNSSDRKR